MNNTTITIQIKGRCDALQLARTFTVRVPHHTVSLQAAISETAAAATGILYLDDAQEFRVTVIRAILQTVASMAFQARPSVIFRVTGPDAKLREPYSQQYMPAVQCIEALIARAQYHTEYYRQAALTYKIDDRREVKAEG